MQRKTRSGRRFKMENYEKRKMTTDKATHFILFPVALSSIGKCNDFYYHTLSLCWNDKNLLRDPRSKHLLHGFYLQEELDINELDKCSETGWFSSSKSNDLVNIGKISGYFIRRNACSVAIALDEKFVPESDSPVGSEKFNDIINSFKIKRTIVPVIVKLEISPESSFNYSKFICLSEELVNNLINGEEVIATRRVKLLKISTELHEWAWRLLNTSTLEGRQNLINDPVKSMCERLKKDLPCSSRCKYPSKRYPSEMFVT